MNDFSKMSLSEIEERAEMDNNWVIYGPEVLRRCRGLERAIGRMGEHPPIKDNPSVWSKGWITGWNSYHRELHVELNKDE